MHKVVHTINLTQKRSKIVFSDTIDLDFKEDFFLCKKVVEIDDLTILFNGNLYNGLSTRVKLNKTIYNTKLKIEGAKICYYGAKDEFLIIPNTKLFLFTITTKK